MYSIISFFIGLVMGWAFRGLKEKQPEMFCSQCNADADQLFIYCPWCGTKNSLIMKVE